ncbi:hypothetical protein Dda_3902 [Drechslerella dactyloides]|uniref:Low temperature requirement A n=1 Tax=Drechslerella dactyloides TaxID=74499 RepID=A0AAD6NJY6_DREDA|nr:hypothetical protein Dda_3902 [Drechslerella dactyloides]
MPDLIASNPMFYRSPTGFDPRGDNTKAEIHEGVLEKRESQRIPAVAVPLEEKPPDEEIPKAALVDDVGKIWTRHAEATWVELFYDLFFVANLTTFTDSHQINDGDSLQSYIGYFAIIWFTWLQAALFDLRFGKDSLIQRIAKALQIGVMVGFSAINHRFNPKYPAENWQAFKNLSLLLFASRFAIAIQYFVVWWTVRQYKKTKVPLLLMSVIMAISMILFLGLAFSFQPQSNVKGYIGWYVILALEAVLVLAISLKWRVVGFKGTHLIQRMGLLTLIVMGEGIIGLCRATSLTNEGLGGWSATMSGQAISGVLCIYFIYMLYFDDEPNYVYSTVPQQIWAILHFPFHLGIVLFVEGQQQLMIWQGIIVSLNSLGAKLQQAFIDGGQNNGGQIANRVLEVIDDFFPDEQAQVVSNNPAFNFNLAPLRDSSDPNFIQQQLDKLWDLCAYAIFSGYNIETPSGNIDLYNGDNKFEGFSQIYVLVVVYFFVAAGGFLLILALFTYLMKWPKDRYEWLHIAYRAIFGVIIALIALVATNRNRVKSLLTGPWIVPMMMLLLLLLLIIDKLTILAAHKYSNRKLNHHRWLTGREVEEPELEADSTSVSSVESSANRLIPMPGVDNPAEEDPNNHYGEYNAYATPSNHNGLGPSGYNHERHGTVPRGNSRDYYVSPSVLPQVAEVEDEDADEPFADARDILEESDDDIGDETSPLHESTPHAFNSSIPSGNPSQQSLGRPSPLHDPDYIPVPMPTASAIPRHMRDRHPQMHAPGRPYEDFLSPDTPPLGATFYEGGVAGADSNRNSFMSSPVIVIRRSFDSLDSLIPRPPDLASINGSESSEPLLPGDRMSTDMPQTHRGFMASPTGFAEDVQGRVGEGGKGGSHAGSQVSRRGRGGGAVAGIGRFMRSTESMMGVRLPAGRSA